MRSEVLSELAFGPVLGRCCGCWSTQPGLPHTTSRSLKVIAMDGSGQPGGTGHRQPRRWLPPTAGG
jgi:hypothetical protein